jgi:hypothetical protein
VHTAKLKSFGTSATRELIYDTQDLLAEYVQAIASYYDTKIKNKQDHSSVKPALISNAWNAQTLNKLMDDTNLPSYAISALTNAIALLEDAELPDEFVKFLLNPTLGSAGVWTIGETKSPLYVTVFPVTYLLSKADRHWNARARKMNPDPGQPSQYHEFEQLKHDTHMLNSFRSGDHERISKDRISRPREGEPAPGHEGFSFSSQPSGSNTPRRPPPTGRQSPNHPHMPQQQQQQQQQASTIPDDTNYEPDSLLNSKAINYTDLVRSKPATELFHDHMERFNITNETPTHVSRSAVRTMESGDADFTIQTRIRGVRTNYVVTYTRMSRKPIFNIIA